eukprot:7353457-Pyramimonas_sp.AAC.1
MEMEDNTRGSGGGVESGGGDAEGGGGEGQGIALGPPVPLVPDNAPAPYECAIKGCSRTFGMT